LVWRINIGFASPVNLLPRIARNFSAMHMIFIITGLDFIEHVLLIRSELI